MADFVQQTGHDDDSVALYSTSSTMDSPLDSTSPSSSSPYLSPPRPPSSLRSTSYMLTVRNLSYGAQPKRQIFTCLWRSSHAREPTKILNSISFDARSSEILAIVGPSGAGKSTLLRVISGRINSSEFNPRSVFLNHHPVASPTQLRKMCGFVTQEDNLLPFLTVKETLMFSARFRLRRMSTKEKEERVTLLMHELGLAHIAYSYIGDEEKRGVSGGEKKRVSIGVDMIHDPPILLLDEPTSGLDSASALQVIELLSSLAKSRQRTIVLTIHQPSYLILQYVSSFLLLSRGSVAHAGSLDSLEETINRMGYIIPEQINSLEYAMEIIKSLESLAASTTPTSYSTWLDYKDQQQQEGDKEEIGQTASRYGGMSVQFWRVYEIYYLVLRFWKTIYRTKQLLLARTMQASVAGLGLGSVYFRLKKDDDGIAERLGLFAFGLSFLLSSTVEALPIFLQERRVLMKEVSRGAYKVSSYVIANTLIFIPFMLAVSLLFSVPVYWIVGLNPSIAAFSFFIMVVWLIVLMASSLVLFLSAVSPDFISGNSLICLVLGAFFLFSGYFIPKDSIPRYWIFMYYVSLYKYPLDALLINEYWSSRQDCFSWQEGDDGSSYCLLTGRDVLKGRGLEESSRWMNVGIMFGFFVFYRVLCWIILARRAAKTML